LNLRTLRELRGMERFFAFLVPIAIPVAIFHFVSGRIGNGIMATGAILLGSAVLIISIRSGGIANEQPVDNPPDDDDDWFGWLEDEDPIDELDRPTDEPLPAPFQAVLDEIWSKRIPGSGDDDSHIRQPR
jgi:hypothetical protein